jgi:hypothetical protein
MAALDVASAEVAAGVAHEGAVFRLAFFASSVKGKDTP